MRALTLAIALLVAGSAGAQEHARVSVTPFAVRGIPPETGVLASEILQERLLSSGGFVVVEGEAELALTGALGLNPDGSVSIHLRLTETGTHDVLLEVAAGTSEGEAPDRLLELADAVVAGAIELTHAATTDNIRALVLMRRFEDAERLYTRYLERGGHEDSEALTLRRRIDLGIADALETEARAELRVGQLSAAQATLADRAVYAPDEDAVATEIERSIAQARERESQAVLGRARTALAVGRWEAARDLMEDQIQAQGYGGRESEYAQLLARVSVLAIRERLRLARRSVALGRPVEATRHLLAATELGAEPQGLIGLYAAVDAIRVRVDEQAARAASGVSPWIAGARPPRHVTGSVLAAFLRDRTGVLLSSGIAGGVEILYAWYATRVPPLGVVLEAGGRWFGGEFRHGEATGSIESRQDAVEAFGRFGPRFVMRGLDLSLTATFAVGATRSFVDPSTFDGGEPRSLWGPHAGAGLAIAAGLPFGERWSLDARIEGVPRWVLGGGRVGCVLMTLGVRRAW